MIHPNGQMGKSTTPQPISEHFLGPVMDDLRRVANPFAVPVVPFSDEQRAFRTVVLFFGGFTQRMNDSNGIFNCSDAVYKQYAGPEVWVQYFDWMARVGELADLLETMSLQAELQTSRRLRLVVVGYSFGGWTATLLCRALNARVFRVAVDELVLCDPVARWFNWTGWTRAMVHSTIRIPPNVLSVGGVYQRNPRFRKTPPFLFPSGHNVVADKPRPEQEVWCDLDGNPFGTALTPFYQLDDEHADIDNSSEFCQLVKTAVSSQVWSLE